MTERPDPLAPPEGYTVTEIGKFLEDTQCDVASAPFYGLAFETRCTGEGVIRIWFGCPHEHVGFADVCSQHKTEVMLGFPAQCARCASAGTDSRSTIIRRQDMERKVTK